MQLHILKIAVPVAAALVFTLNGAAYAGTPQQTDKPPVDCKKKPDDPRCKDKKY